MKHQNCSALTGVSASACLCVLYDSVCLWLCVVTWETDTTVCPAYGDGAMLGSLFIVEAFSDTDREEGELVVVVEELHKTGRGQVVKISTPALYTFMKQHPPYTPQQFQRLDSDLKTICLSCDRHTENLEPVSSVPATDLRRADTHTHR